MSDHAQEKRSNSSPVSPLLEEELKKRKLYWRGWEVGQELEEGLQGVSLGTNYDWRELKEG